MKTPERRQASSGVGEQLHLIEPPPFSPTYPPRSSLPGRAVAMTTPSCSKVQTEAAA